MGTTREGAGEAQISGVTVRTSPGRKVQRREHREDRCHNGAVTDGDRTCDGGHSAMRRIQTKETVFTCVCEPMNAFSHLREGNPAICSSTAGLEGMARSQFQVRTDIVCSLSLGANDRALMETETVVHRLGEAATCWSEGTCFPLDRGSVRVGTTVNNTDPILGSDCTRTWLVSLPEQQQNGNYVG